MICSLIYLSIYLFMYSALGNTLRMRLEILKIILKNNASRKGFIYSLQFFCWTWRNRVRAKNWNDEIQNDRFFANIKITKDELFDSFIFEFIFEFFRNDPNTRNI